jgi:cytochrome c oxidase subunit 4
MTAVQKRLALVWLALMGFLGLTIGASYLLTGASSVVAGLGIAAGKAALVFWFFMQLKEEKGLIRVFALGALVWLGILLTFTAIDYAAR